MRLRLNTILATVGIFMYLLAAIGIPVFQHYCGGELEAVSVYSKSNSCCGSDEDSTESDCCHNEVHVAKYDAQSSLKTTARLQSSPAFICNFLAPTTILLDTFSNPSSTNIVKSDLAPPPLLHQTIIDTAVLRI